MHNVDSERYSLSFFYFLSYIQIRKEMPMKKVGLFSLILLLSFLSISNVYAEKIYYTNSYGVNFTEKQYKYFTDMFWDGYQTSVTQDEFNKVQLLNLFESTIEKEKILIPIESFEKGPSLTQNGRTTTISKSCSTQCLVTLNTTWNTTPTIQSWDVTGVRISGTSLGLINTAKVYGSGYFTTYSTPKVFTNGFGYSVDLPNTSNIKVSISFYAGLGGTIYGTYQHAMSNTTEPISKLYTINSTGYGGVFSFSGSAIGIYDGAGGVNISL